MARSLLDFEKLKEKRLVLDEIPPRQPPPMGEPPPAPLPLSSWRRAPDYVLAIFLGVIGIPYLVGSTDGIFLLSGADLYIHEVGHLFFAFFGRFICVAGGTLLQLAVPVAATVSFRVTRQRLSSLFGLFWIGENLLNVSHYVADARTRAIPLVNFGGEVGPEGHDWHYLLGTLGLLRADHFLGAVVWLAGAGLIISSLLAAVAPPERWQKGWAWLKPRLEAFLFNPTDRARRSKS